MNASRSFPTAVPSSNLSRTLGRGFVALLTLGLAGGALALVVGSETPRGAVYGRVTGENRTLNLAGARIVLSPANDPTASHAELDDSPAHTRRTVADKTGRFQLTSVPAGDYYLTATTRAHESSGEGRFVSISEGQFSLASLELKRSQPEIALAQERKTFAPGESVVLPVRGYIGGATPPANGKPPTSSASMSTDTLRVRIWQTRISDVLSDSQGSDGLREVGNRWDDPHPIPATMLAPKSAPAPRLLSDALAPIRSADAEGFFHEKINLPSQPGLYLVQIDHAKIAACAWVQVGGTALVTKKAGDTMLTFVADVRSGAPRAGFMVRALRDGKAIATGVTDVQGLAQFELPKAGEDESSQTLIVATRNTADGMGDESAIQRSDYEYEEKGDYSVALLTDRPIYRPGQQVFYKGIARRALQTGAVYSIPANQTVEVELRDPDGNKVLKETRRTSGFGAFWGRADLSSEAPSGTYTLVSTIDGEEHTQDVTVASYRKPEFSVTVQPLQKRYTRGQTVEALISAQYFFGAPVAGAKVHYEVLREGDWADEYPDGDYDDLDEDSEGDGESYGEVAGSGDVLLDAEGRATVRIPPPAENDTDQTSAYDSQPQADNWTISASVTDSAGREQDGSGVAHVTQGAYRVFIQPLGSLAKPGQPLPVVLEARDYDGKPVVGAQLQLKAALYSPPKKDDAQDTSSDDATDDGYDTIFAARSVQTDAAGRAQTQITPPHSGESRLTATSTDRSGHEITGRTWVYALSDTEADAANSWEWGDNNSLTLVTDKRHYKPGETARVLVGAASPGAVALITVEGDRIHRAWTIPMRGHTALIQVPIKAEYGPNVSLAACTLRDKQLSKAETPLRVDVPAREVAVKVIPDAPQGAPGGKAGFSVQTRDAGGKPVSCDVALGVVDEGIYAMRGDDPTLLRDTFYPRRSNDVSTNFSLDVEYLGEGDKADPVVQARRRFEDTAFWLPNLQTDANGQAHVEFALPDNLTTWRATAWAQTRNDAFGRATSDMLETKPFFVRLESPRFWVDGDNSRVLATLHNETNVEQSATVKLEADGLNVDGGNQTATIAANGSATLTWAVTPQMTGLNSDGDARLKLTAWTDDRKHTDAVEQMVPVSAHGRDDITDGAGRATQTAPAMLTLTVPPNTVPQTSRLTVRIAPTIAGSVAGALDYLTGFPYGCTEQTLSRFVPDLAVEGFLRGANADPARRARLARMVRDSVTRLSRFQHESGGWGWWEHDDDDPWMTAYALYGLTMARDQGYNVNSEMIDKAVKAGAAMPAQIRSNPKAWASQIEAVPFLLWAMSGANSAGRAIAQRERAKITLNPLMGNEELAYIVLLDKSLAGSGQGAQIFSPSASEVKNLSQSWDALERRMTAGDDGRLHWKGDDVYEGDRLATALGLRAMLAVNPNDERATSVLLWMMGHRTGDYWGSTRDTAFTLLAAGDYMRDHPEASNLTGSIRVSLNGRTVKTLQLGPAMLHEPEIAIPVSWQRLRSGTNTLQIERTGGASSAFYSYEMRATREATTLAPLSSGGVNVKREYLKVLPLQNGEDSWSLQTQPSNGNFAQGDQVRVRLTIWSSRPLEHVIVEDHFPSSLEVTERGEANEQMDWDSWWSNTDVRDDRIAFFSRRMSPGKHVIEYNLRAQTPGEGRAMPTLVQEMYAPQVRAESGDTTIRVQ